MHVKILIDPDRCVASANCVAWAPHHFTSGVDGKALSRHDVVQVDEELRDAVEGCPVQAIRAIDPETRAPLDL
jgi:ferredoxin